MCPPTYFDVVYSINPWMAPETLVDRDRAVAQWEELVATYELLGHTVELIEPLAGLPDMVFAANGAVVVDGRVLVARFRHAERAAEAGAHHHWFRRRGYRDIRVSRYIAEGEGDYLCVGDRILAASGFRTERRSHADVQAFFGRPVVELTLVDPRFYHLDTALAVLDAERIMYYPQAFSAASRRTLERTFPDAIAVGDLEAGAFELNAVCDGRNVVMPAAGTGLADRLQEHGFHPIGIDCSELAKAGGGVKCCTLELRPEREGSD